MSRRATFGMLGLLGLLAAGCAGDDHPSSEDVRQAAPEWRAEPELRIGSLDGPDHLTQVTQALLGPSGELIISQPRDLTVRIHDPSGDPVATVGQRGEGPGESQWLGPMWLSGGTLRVSDRNLGRVSAFDLEGEVLFTRRWFSGTGEMGEPGLQLTPPRMTLQNGTALVRPWPLTPFIPPDEEVQEVDSIPILRIDGDGETQDTLAMAEEDRTRVPVESGGEAYPLSPPFPDAPLLEFVPDGEGLAFVRRRVGETADAAEFTVGRIDAQGDTVMEVSLPYDPVPVSSEILASAIQNKAEELEARYGAAPAPQDAEQALERTGFVPETLPPVTDLVVGRDGSIWLRGEALPKDSVRWSALDSEGRIQGRTSLPRGQSISDADGDVVVTIQQGEFDEHYVTRHRLRDP